MPPKRGRNLTYGQKQEILARDDYSCVVCGRGDDGGKHRLEVHHRDGDHRNSDPTNLETQGQTCHKQTHKAGIPGIIAKIKADLSRE